MGTRERTEDGVAVREQRNWTQEYVEPRYADPLQVIHALLEGEDQTEEHPRHSAATDSDEQILAIYDEMRPSFFGYLRSLRLPPEEIEEIIQEAFVALTAALQESRPIANVRGWLVRVVNYLGIKAQQRHHHNARQFIDTAQRVIENISDRGTSPEQAYLQKEQMERMEAALASLKPLHRQCFYMRANGLAYREIGVALEISTQRAALIVKQVAVRMAAICG